MEGIEGDTCTAERINKPEYPYLENTIPSMEAAFKAGADLVEFDVQPTKDNNFVIFHDWTLDCVLMVKVLQEILQQKNYKHLILVTVIQLMG